MSQVYLPVGTTDLGTLASLDTVDFIISAGNQTVSLNLDQSALATGIANIFFGEQATVTFKGASGTPLNTKVTGNFLHKGGGTFFWTPKATSAKLQNIGYCQMNIGGTGTLTTLENAGQATTTIDDTTVVTNIYCIGTSVTESYKSSAHTTLWCSNSTLTCERSWTGTALVGAGGFFNWGRSDKSLTPPTGGTLIMGSGTFKSSGGNIATINACGDAILDFREVTQACALGGTGGVIITAAVRDRSYFKSKYGVTITLSGLVVIGSENQNIAQ